MKKKFTIDDIILKPISGLINKFNSFLKNLVEKLKDGKKGILEERKKGNEETFKIIVEDNGCRIPEKNIDKNFDIFFTTKGSRKTGFAIVQKIVKEHNVNIEVNLKLGQGMIFKINFLNYRRKFERYRYSRSCSGNM